jgi:hypothetical protein
LSIAAVVILSKKTLRQSLASVLNAAIVPAVLIPIVLFVFYCVGLIYILSKSGIWLQDNLDETVIWFASVGLLMFLKANESTRPGFFRNFVETELKIAVGIGILEFITNFYVFELWIEMLFVPFLFVLFSMLGIASTGAKYKPVEKLLGQVVSFIGLGLLVYLGVNLFTNPMALLSPSALREYMMPIFLTIGSLPYFYFLALYLIYDRIFRIQNAVATTSSRFDYLRILISFHLI